jgi:hypothetical protein
MLTRLFVQECSGRDKKVNFLFPRFEQILNPMKAVFSSLFLVLISQFVFAQINIEKTYVFKGGMASDFEIVAKNNIVNEKSENDTLRWIRIKKEMTGGWESATCDNQTCWFPEIDSSEFVIEPEESANLDIYFYPQGNEGGGTVELLVYRPSEGRMNADTITYESSSSTQGLTEGSGTGQFSLYPNPTSETAIFDYNGKEEVSLSLSRNGGILETRQHEQGITEIDLKKYPSGIYFLEIQSSTGSIIKRIIKE